MFHKYSRTIAAVVLGFFTWTSGGVFSIAHAAVDGVKKGKAQAQQKKADGPEARFGKVTEELTAALADPKATVAAKRERLKSAQGEIAAIDLEVRKGFAVTEKRLKDAKLPAEILERHYKFVKHYDDNLAELQTNLSAVAKARDDKEAQAAIEKTRAHLERVKAPSRHQPLDPNNLPNRQPKVIKREPRLKKEEFERDLKRDKHAWRNQKRIMVASVGSLAGLITPDDLSETIDVQFTPEIKAKAQELGNNPVKIYEWVRNNFRYEPYYGSLKGAQQTLLEISGNDFDQASLLIALLRASNIPARYVYGTIELPIDRVMSWLGVEDPTTAANIIATGGIPSSAGVSGGKITTIRLEHVWVEAFVNMYPSFGAKNGPGNAWTPIDPSFKEQELNDAVDLSNIVKFDESGYLRAQSKLPPSLSYLFALEDYHTANYDGGMHEMFYLKRIKEQEFGILLGTLPYKTIVVGSKFTSIDAALRHQISIGLRDPATDDLRSITKNVCELTGKKITVSYAPASDQDSAVMANYGGLLKTPAYLEKVKAQVKIDDTVVLEGPPISMGESLKLSLQFDSPGSNSDRIETDMAAGIYYNVGLSALNIADNQALGGLDNSENLIGTFYNSINNGDDQVGKVLHNIGLQYFTHTNSASKLLEGLMYIYNTRAVNAGFVSVSAKYSYLFDLPSSPPIISGLLLDIKRYIQSPFSLTGDTAQEKEFTKIQGLNTSYFEHAIWESFSGIDSVSTVKLLQLANEAGLPIYTINNTNLNATLPLLSQSQQVKDDIRNAVAAGKEVTIPGSYITRNEWTGTGYMVRNPDTGDGAYMISGGLAGGGSTNSPSSISLLGRLLSGQYAALAIGQPARHLALNLGLVNWLEAGYDDIIIGSISDMLLAKGFIPRHEHTFSREKLLNLINRPDNWIVYYTGHGYSDPEEGDWLIPGYIGEDRQDRVYPSDINTNARIVFLDACHSGERGSFVNSFGPDNQIFMGWYHAVEYIESGDFAFDWWRSFVSGKTVLISAGGIADGKYVTPSSNLNEPYLVIKGGSLTLDYLH
ncbi:MAG TPA: transglutaminase domain-containing protein [Geobacteraceae bacterium]